MFRLRLHPYDIVILLLLAVLIWRGFGVDPAKDAWQVGHRHLLRGEYGEAARHFDQVIALRPDFDRVYFYRGLAMFFQGDHRDAAVDFDAGLGIGGDPYMLYWRFLAHQRIHGGGEDSLRDGMRVRGLDTGQWPGVLGGLLLGEAEEQTALRLADEATPDLRRGRLAEAYFYIGQRRMIEGRKEEAIEAFRMAVGTRATNYIEYMGAVQELLAAMR